MKIIGRRAFIASALALVGAAALDVGSAFAAVETPDPEVLKNELRVKNEKEAAFVEDVVEKARDGELPMKIFQVAYRYAKQKSKDRRVFYFKKCLESLTKQAGLKIEFLPI